MLNCSKILAKTCKLEWLWLGPDGSKATNIMYLEDVAADFSLPSVLSDVTVKMHGAIGSTSIGILKEMSNTWSLHTATAIDNSGTSDNSVTFVIDNVGGSGTVALPPNDCVVASWHILPRYRGGHPRTYLSGLRSSIQGTPGGRHLDTTAQTAISTAMAYWLNAMNTPDGTLTGPSLGTIASQRTTGGVAACLVPPQFEAYQSVSADSRLCSQRRRLGRV